jgi:IclR family transcriptional regulator, blcABC operon repressor
LSSQRDLAPAVTRAIQLLDALSRSPQPLGLGELAAVLQLPKSSVHGLCRSLLAGRLIERRDGGSYSLGLRIVDFANARLGQNDLAQDFLRFWSGHPEFGNEAAIMSELIGTDVVYLACRNSSRPLGVTFRVGMRLPAAITATGKAILSTLEDGELERLYDRKSGFDPLTRRSVKSLAALKRQLREVRRNGHSIDDGETREGMCSFGAPVLARSGKNAVAGVAISFFRAELNERRAKQAIAAIKELALMLSDKAAKLSP